MGTMTEWKITERTIRSALVTVSAMRREAVQHAAQALSLAAEAQRGEGQRVANAAADALETAKRRAASAEAHFAEALALWYTCPDAGYNTTEAGRYTAYALALGWKDMAAARIAAQAVHDLMQG